MPSLRQCNLFINGREEKPSSENYFIRENPATEKDFAQIAESNNKDVDSAVSAAKVRFGAWSKVTSTELAKLLLKIAYVLANIKKQITILHTFHIIKQHR